MGRCQVPELCAAERFSRSSPTASCQGGRVAQTLSALQVGSMGDCSRNTLNFLSLARSLIFFFNIFPPLFTGFVKAPEMRAEIERKRKQILSQFLSRAGKWFPSLLCFLRAPERFYELKQSVSQEALERKRGTREAGLLLFPSGAELWCFRRREPRAFSQPRLGLWQPLGSQRGRRRLAPLH